MHSALPRLLESVVRPIVCAQDEHIERPAPVASGYSLAWPLLPLKSSVRVVYDDPRIVVLGVEAVTECRKLDGGALP